MTITESGSGSAASSDPTTIRPFTVEIPQAEVDDMPPCVMSTSSPSSVMRSPSGSVESANSTAYSRVSSPSQMSASMSSRAIVAWAR